MSTSKKPDSRAGYLTRNLILTEDAGSTHHCVATNSAWLVCRCDQLRSTGADVVVAAWGKLGALTYRTRLVSGDQIIWPPQIGSVSSL